MKLNRTILMFTLGGTLVLFTSMLGHGNTEALVVVLDKTYSYHNSATNAVNIAPGHYGSASINCPNGQVATGGGFDEGVTNTNPPTLTIVGSYPTPTTSGSTPTGWLVNAYNPTSATLTLVPVVVCQVPAP